MSLSTTGSAHIASTGLSYGSRMGHILHSHQMRIHLSWEIGAEGREEGRNGGRREERKQEDARTFVKTAAILNCQPLPLQNDKNIYIYQLNPHENINHKTGPGEHRGSSIPCPALLLSPPSPVADPRSPPAAASAPRTPAPSRNGASGPCERRRSPSRAGMWGHQRGGRKSQPPGSCHQNKR